MELQTFLAEDFNLKFLKWVEIILQEDKAVKLDSMYILVRDNKYCDLIFIDNKGYKRKIENVSKESLRSDFPLKDLSNMNEEQIVLWKNTFGIEDLEYTNEFFNDIQNKDVRDEIKQLIDEESGVGVNFNIGITSWYDGRPITDTLLDNDIFIKKGSIYYQRTIDKNTFLKINNISELRGQNGYYEGQEVALLGYYVNGDKPPLTYKFTVNNFDTYIDNGGNVIKTNRGTWIADFGGEINIKHFGAKGDNSTNDQLAFDRCLLFCKNSVTPYQIKAPIIYVPRGSYILNKISYDYQSFQMKGDGSELSVFKFLDQMGDNVAGIFPLDDTLDTSTPGFEFYKNILIENIGCDPSTIGDGKSFILLRNAYDFTIRNVNLPTDTFANVNKFALKIADNVYTGSIENSYLPKINCTAQIAWTITTISFINVRSMNIRMINCLGMTFLQPVIQGQENEKILINNCDTVSIYGGDMEDSGIYLNFAGTNSNIRSIGNNILALGGAYTNGVVPENSYFDDKGNIGVAIANQSGQFGKFAVKSGTGTSIAFTALSSAGNVYNIMGNLDGGVNNKYTYDGSASSYKTWGKINDDLTTRTEFMRLTDSGNLLIGTTDDSGAKLHVAGLIKYEAGESTSASSGSASVLPSNPAGYIEIDINGTIRKMPFFNT